MARHSSLLGSGWHLQTLGWKSLGNGLARTELLVSLPAGLASWELVLPASARLPALWFSYFDSIHLPRSTCGPQNVARARLHLLWVLCSPLDESACSVKGRVNKFIVQTGGNNDPLPHHIQYVDVCFQELSSSGIPLWKRFLSLLKWNSLDIQQKILSRSHKPVMSFAWKIQISVFLLQNVFPTLTPNPSCLGMTKI